jgi:hypothetical protein
MITAFLVTLIIWIILVFSDGDKSEHYTWYILIGISFLLWLWIYIWEWNNDVVVNKSNTNTYKSNTLNTSSTKIIDVKYRWKLSMELEKVFIGWNTYNWNLPEMYYDPKQRYMIVNLWGIYYHYCWINWNWRTYFKESSNVYDYYEKYIRWKYDCRQWKVPDYPNSTTYVPEIQNFPQQRTVHVPAYQWLDPDYAYCDDENEIDCDCCDYCEDLPEFEFWCEGFCTDECEDSDQYQSEHEIDNSEDEENDNNEDRDNYEEDYDLYDNNDFDHRD